MLRFLATQCCFLVAEATLAHRGLGVPKVGRNHGPVVLPLSRKLTKLGGAESWKKSSYVGTIRIGATTQAERQEMLVLFDTGSGQVIVDSTRCTAPACLKHHQYSPERSNAPVVNGNGQIADPGAESDHAVVNLDSNDAEPGNVQGVFVRDHVCLGVERRKGSDMDGCAEVILIAATNMTDQPFSDVPFDGIVGLGLEGLSAGPEYNFLGRLTAQEGMKPQFALFVPNQAEGRAEITFGGFQAERLAGPLSWAPVAEPEVGFWQVVVKAVRIGDQEMDICKDSVCRGFVDSSSSLLGVPEDVMTDLEVAMGFKDGAALSQGNGGCTVGPDLQLVLESGLTLTLTAREYATEAANTGGCRSLLHPLRNTETAGSRHVGDEETRKGTALSRSFILGEPVLRRYYTVFDWESKLLGFGLAAASTTASPSSMAEEAEMPEHTEEFILLQTHEQRSTMAKHEL